MVALGLVLLILGIVLGIPVLQTIGWIVLIVGLILLVLGLLDRSVGPRRYYW